MRSKENIIEITLSSVATIYTIWYMHFGVAYKNSGALSKIGIEHPIYFCIWGVLTFLALALGIISGYKKYTKTKLYIPLLIISGIGMILTLTNDFDYNKRVEYYLHCGGSLAFSITTGICIFLLFFFSYKQGKINKIFTFISAVILIADGICLLIFKETGLIEALPIFAGYLMLGITNLRREKIGIKG